jgi:hypothetical protein
MELKYKNNLIVSALMSGLFFAAPESQASQLTIKKELKIVGFKQAATIVLLALGVAFSGNSEASLYNYYSGPDISLAEFLKSAPDKVSEKLATTNISAGIIDNSSDLWYQRNITSDVSIFGRQIGGSINEFWIKYNLAPSSTSTGALWVPLRCWIRLDRFSS